MREQHAWFWQRQQSKQAVQQREAATWGGEVEGSGFCRGCDKPLVTNALYCGACTRGQMRDERKLDIDAQKAARRAARKGGR